MRSILKHIKTSLICTAILLLLVANAFAMINGINVTSGTPVNLTAKEDHISTADGGSVYLWGYANGADRAQYPGPVLIADEGATVVINLTNSLPPAAGNVSILFPGQQVTATGGVAGLLTREASSGGGTVSYQFTASAPGTYLYRSGTNPEIQAEMGLIGALIIRPSIGANYAY